MLQCITVCWSVWFRASDSVFQYEQVILFSRSLSTYIGLFWHVAVYYSLLECVAFDIWVSVSLRRSTSTVTHSNTLQYTATCQKRPIYIYRDLLKRQMNVKRDQYLPVGDFLNAHTHTHTHIYRHIFHYGEVIPKTHTPTHCNTLPHTHI